MQGIIQKTSKILSLSFVLALALQTGFGLLTPQYAEAGYSGGRLINNNVFLDAKSMSKSQISNFLEKKNSGLATKKATLDCYGQNSQERKLYKAAGAPCDQKVKASTIIYYAGQIYGISPRVILATLQKEQSLITTANPTSWQYRNAMGYGCPTDGDCTSSGFYRQIDFGTWALRYHFERARKNNTWWNTSSGWVCGTKKKYYKPNLYPNQNVTFIDGNGVSYRTHKLKNAATSAFYCYTPHAYNNPDGLYGRAPYGTKGQYYSGSYNFVYWFERWWGSTTTAPTYEYSLVSKKLYSDSARTNEISISPTLDAGEKVYVKIRVENEGNATWTNDDLKLATAKGNGSSSEFYNDDWLASGRVTTMEEDIVSPGERATFLTSFVAPSEGGTFREHFTLIDEGTAWFSYESGMYFDVTVVPNRDFAVYSDPSRTNRLDNSNLKIVQGETVYVTVAVKNDSEDIWPENRTKVATTNPNNRISDFGDGTWSSSGRPGRFTEELSPGNTGTTNFTLTAPETLGSYEEQFGLVIENGGWIDTNIAILNINVVEPSTSEMYNNESLRVGDELISRNGDYRMVLQGDGNLVIYSSGKVVWTTKTNGTNAKRLTLQGDGNLVLYKNGGQSVWASKTRKDNPNKLAIQNDGNAVLYRNGKAVWSSGTRGL